MADALREVKLTQLEPCRNGKDKTGAKPGGEYGALNQSRSSSGSVAVLSSLSPSIEADARMHGQAQAQDSI